MSGPHSWLVDMLSDSFLDCILKPGILGLLRAILQSQYIRKPHDDVVHRVRCGAGMGLSCVCDLADLSFYSCAEKTVALSTSCRRDCGILAYLRFQDDGLIILDKDSSNLGDILAEVHRGGTIIFFGDRKHQRRFLYDARSRV